MLDEAGTDLDLWYSIAVSVLLRPDIFFSLLQTLYSPSSTSFHFIKKQVGPLPTSSLIHVVIIDLVVVAVPVVVVHVIFMCLFCFCCCCCCCSFSQGICLGLCYFYSCDTSALRRRNCRFVSTSSTLLPRTDIIGVLVCFFTNGCWIVDCWEVGIYAFFCLSL